MKVNHTKIICFFLLIIFAEWILLKIDSSENGIVHRLNLSFIRVRTKSIFDTFSGVTGGNGEFRSGWGNVISNAISLTFPSSCVGQLINIGYLSSELDEDDYPFNPNCGAQSQSNNLCFPGNSLIITKERGEIELKDLNIGDHILIRDLNTMELRYSKVEIMLHKDKNLYFNDEWIQVEYLGMKEPLVLSPNHLIFTQYLGETPQEGNCLNPKLIENVIGVETTPLLEKKRDIYSIQAKDIQVGDSVVIYSKERVSWVTRVSLISNVKNKLKEYKYIGRYAPLTADGYLIVNGVLVSSYSKPFPWPMDLLNPSHRFIDLLARPFINAEIHFQKIFEYTKREIKWILRFISSISSKYTFDQSIALSLEVIRAISLLIK
ncbi:hedgehog-type HINT domain-containing protein [Cryptosporidium ubiquitum]|uniref:Hedgehog-type HINT domain-containing protein n=1 Tax=Cryptosporidium ubiquitum TaxID=857276 RepID=A0A1J4MLR2_9CRYT|nr:hedgehog-type HINT domain-containing protein [Cryptosporidium ubiquitum]OII75185.1 hedgehog-type HINT domain-containing protein [Cryptosporidium ubiquitum]